MNIRITITVVFLYIAVASAWSPAANAQSLTIDDFTAGEYREELINASRVAYQTGPTDRIVGGVRQTVFGVAPFEGSDSPTVLRIRRGGPMIIDGGWKSTFGLYLGYGSDSSGNPNPLNLGLQQGGYDRFRINFDSSDLTLGFLMQVYDGDGDLTTLSSDVETAGQASPFSADFRFADFPAGFPGPINWNDIDYILVLFQTGTAIGGNDFAVTSIVVLGPPVP